MGFLELRRLRFHIGNHIGRNVALVEIHTFHHFFGKPEGLRFFHGNHTVFAHFFHNIGDHSPHFFGFGRDGGHLGDFFPAADFFGIFLENFYDIFFSRFHPLAHSDGIDSGFNEFQAFAHQSLRHQCGGGCSVAGRVVGFVSHFFHQFRADVFKLVFQLNVLGDSHAVIGDGGRSEAFVQNHVSSPGAKRHFYRVGHLVHAGFDFFARVGGILDLLAHIILFVR